jgi:hypothetical protein
VFNAIINTLNTPDLRMKLCSAVANYAEEAFYDGDAAVLKALQTMLHNVMKVTEPTVKRRLNAVLACQVVNEEQSGN